jgi:two-component system LytT family response regulator
LRALIVDDEPLARRGISLRLAAFDVEIVGECADGVSAVKCILELAPDLVFLDIQMAGKDGFEVLRNLPKERIPLVIFLTAYEQHAIRAFAVHAVDYLLKPIDDDRFAEAFHRAVALFDAGTQKQQYLSRFIVRTGSRLQVVLADETDWIGSADDYAELHTKGRTHLLRETLSELDRRLDPAKFMRIHRSRIVRTDCITELQSIDNREYLVKLIDGSQHRSSRTYADRLTKWLKPNAKPSPP